MASTATTLFLKPSPAISEWAMLHTVVMLLGLITVTGMTLINQTSQY